MQPSGYLAQYDRERHVITKYFPFFSGDVNTLFFGACDQRVECLETI